MFEGWAKTLEKWLDEHGYPGYSVEVRFPGHPEINTQKEKRSVSDIVVNGAISIIVDSLDEWQLCTEINNAYFLCWFLYRIEGDILIPVAKLDGAGMEMKIYPNNPAGQVMKTSSEMTAYLIGMLDVNCVE